MTPIPTTNVHQQYSSGTAPTMTIPTPTNVVHQQYSPGTAPTMTPIATPTNVVQHTPHASASQSRSPRASSSSSSSDDHHLGHKKRKKVKKGFGSGLKFVSGMADIASSVLDGLSDIDFLLDDD
eukprot:TRINITY_DN7725_c0_g1_i1.p2 TRINITY_DN7725_c0_g1~~TRINITY_DN7725_c0_g1_i1.p2  ORF type:complete len:124 (-),score=26.41 TRINITY_DN7725_c0_g1_i1:378-749(-)